MFKAFGNAFELNVALRVPKALWDLKISLLRTTSADAERQKKRKIPSSNYINPWTHFIR